MYNFVYAAYTHEGNVRKNNEDNFLVDQKYKKEVSDDRLLVKGSLRGKRFLAAVCDGMGGQDYGELASLTAVRALAAMRKQKKNAFLLEDDLEEYVTAANSEICELMREKEKRIGTTFAAIEFFDGYVVAANIGDSRIYRLHDGELTQVSVDHSTVGQLLRMGMITKEQAAAHPKKNEITQCLGIFPEEMILEPAVTAKDPVCAGDRYLLCSDGLTGELSDEQIREILAASEGPGDAVTLLVDGALEKKGRDNITAVVIEVLPKLPEIQGEKTPRICRMLNKYLRSDTGFLHRNH